MAGAEVGDPNLAYAVIEARVQKCMREGAARESRGSQAAVPMASRVWSRVAEGVAREWRGRHRTRIWSCMRDGAGGEWIWRRRW
jgi:hypothetical protein